jgi:hypothetical protein
MEMADDLKEHDRTGRDRKPGTRIATVKGSDPVTALRETGSGPREKGNGPEMAIVKTNNRRETRIVQHVNEQVEPTVRPGTQGLILVLRLNAWIAIRMARSPEMRPRKK